MKFAEVAQASERIAATAKRTEKLALLADCIARMSEDELEAGVHFLAGEISQGKIGIGYASLRDLFELQDASEPTLSVADVDLIHLGLRVLLAPVERLPELLPHPAAGARRELAYE